MEATFNAIDALVLSAVYQNNKIDLVQWIGMIDFYERIILTFDEWNTSLEKRQRAAGFHDHTKKSTRTRAFFVENRAKPTLPFGCCLRKSFANRYSKECHVWI